MHKKHFVLISIILLLASLLYAQSANRYKILTFDNPGTKRLLKTEAGNYYYYRGLPERALLLNTTGVNKIEIRSFSNGAVRKPEIVIITGKERKVYPLVFKEKRGEYYLYQPLTIEVTENTKNIQLICYDRSIYMRAFSVLPPQPPKAKKQANLVIRGHSGIVNVLHNGSNSDYYSFMPGQPLKFTLNNGRNAYLYVRPRLLDRSIPKLGIYANGELVEVVEFNLKRTTKYHSPGITNLGIAKKIVLPVNTKSTEYELRALSEHLFLAKPIIIKK
ncbi:MAG: hypothetical protein ABFC98_05690 [Candidatus Cloacimonas sp.]